MSDVFPKKIFDFLGHAELSSAWWSNFLEKVWWEV
jgi:hypothetical protein